MGATTEEVKLFGAQRGKTWKKKRKYMARKMKTYGAPHQTKTRLHVTELRF